MVDSRTDQAWTVARFGFEGGDASFLGYHDGRKWNGFPCAYFELSEAKRLASHLVQDPDAGYGGFSFEKTTRTLVLFRDDAPDAVRVKGEDIAFDGRTLRVYGVGEGLTLHARPALCESCVGEYLTDDFQCPKCGVSHTASACATCGRFGLHKDDCDEPPGHDTEGGPAHRTTEERVAEQRELASTFDRAYQYYNGWGFAFEHPGYFSYYQLGGELTVLFTPDHDKYGVVPVAVNDETGESVSFIGDFDFKGKGRSAPALFRIVKPTLDALAGKSAADIKNAKTN